MKYFLFSIRFFRLLCYRTLLMTVKGYPVKIVIIFITSYYYYYYYRYYYRYYY